MKHITDKLTANVPTLEIRPPVSIKPKVILFNVSSSLTEHEIVEELYSKNLSNMPKHDIVDNIKLLFKVGPRNRETVHWVVEVNTEIRRALIYKQRAFIGWNSSIVSEILSE